MREILALAIANPIAVILLGVISVWGGLFALLHMPVVHICRGGLAGYSSI